MTAEIAVLNKLAVALAADSAVTLKSPFKTKIFNTVNKLFSLSKYHPVGIMVHGNSEFMGVPWEVIIKTYREKLGSTDFPSLKGYLDDFVNSLEANRVLNLDYEEKQFVLFTVKSYFRFVRRSIDDQVTRAIKSQSKITDEGVTKAASEVLDGELSRMRGPIQLSSLPANHAEAMLTAHGADIDKLIGESFEKLPISTAAADQLRELAVCLFTRDSFPLAQYSGVVVAGFGTADTYPSLESIRIHGRTAGKLKSKMDDPTAIRPEMEAAIVPFAQRDEVDAFMTGINPKYSEAMNSFLHELLAAYPESIAKTLSGLSEPEKATFIEKWKKVSEESLAGFKKEMEAFVAKVFADPVISAVAALPKDELASMAETLVSLTSFKRKVTLEEEQTVGGPIDVAVISKGDGFVWIKRKHYFSPELNPHFMIQYFKRGSAEAGHGSQE